MAEQPQDRKGQQTPALSLATLLDNLPGMAYRCRNNPDWTMEFVRLARSAARSTG